MPAMRDIQISLSSSKSVPLNLKKRATEPCKKKSFDYGNPDNQSLTFQPEIYSLLVLVTGKLVTQLLAR